MSTKIYNGIRFKTDSIFEVHTQMMKWRERIEVLTDHLKAKVMAEYSCRVIDRAIMKGEPVPSAPVGDAWNDIRDRQREVKKTGYRDPEIDFDFEVCILPWNDQLFGIIYTEQSEWRREFMKQGWVEEFGYWDNTDRPRKLTAAQWEDRRECWDAIFDQNSKAFGPAKFGFTADCTAVDYTYPGLKLVLRKMPKFEDRVRKHARNNITSEKSRELMEVDNVPDDDQRVHEILRYYFKAEKWLETEEGSAILAAEIERLKGILPEKITAPMLTPNHERLM